MTTLATIVSFVLRAYAFLILIRVLLSWINVNSYGGPRLDHPLIQILYRITDPVLDPFRRLIPPIGGAIDVSPIIVLILIEILRTILVRLLIGL